jgi:hypothetical protein
MCQASVVSVAVGPTRPVSPLVEPKSGSAAGEGEYLHTTLSARSLQFDIFPALRRRFQIILKRVVTSLYAII